MKNFGINQVGVPKCQVGTVKGGLQPHNNSGTWGNRGQGNELQSALEKGLSWLGDKFVNGADYLEDGFNYLLTTPLAAITGKTKEVPRVIDQMRKQRHDMQQHVAMNPVFDMISPVKGGWMLKGLMKGSQLEKQLSKAGTININGLQAYLNKASKLEQDVIGRILNTKFSGQKTINYNDLKKAVQEELINYSRIPASEYEDYGFTSLGFDKNHPVQFNTFTFASDKIPNGNSKHFYANTLGHSRTFTLPEEPNILYVMESQSDWAQKKVKHSLEKLLQRKNNIQKNIDELIESSNNPETMQYAVKQINEELLPPLYEKLTSIQSDIARLTESDLQKLHLIENYPYRQIQENMKFASEKGNSLMRYPTRESAIKIEGYIPEEIPQNIYKEWSDEVLQYAKKVPISPYTPEIYKLTKKLEKVIDKKEIDKIQGQLKKAKTVEQRWFNGEPTYALKYEGILDKYADFPKMFNKLFKGQEVRTVTDSKGNTWYEVDIPENFLQSEWQFKQGGKIGINKIIGL